MPRKPRALAVLLLIGTTFSADPHIAAEEAHGDRNGNVQYVKPIDWDAFSKRPETPNAQILATVLSRASRYLVHWLQEKAPIPLPKNRELSIRSLAFNAATLAVILRTGVYSKERGGIPKEQAEQLVWICIERLAPDHTANGGVWGSHWQSPLWAAYAGEAAWLCWESGSRDNRHLVVQMLVHEADRILDRPPPSWNGQGGNSRAEENGWDAFIVEIPSQMLPNHSHARRWREQAIRYRLNAVATEHDTGSEALVNGMTVNRWVGGFNVLPTGAVVNHGVDPHPTYTSCGITQPGRGALFYALAGNPVPEANRYNGRLIYDCLVTRTWDSPPFAKPGGTILSTEGTVYWPAPGGREMERARQNSRWSSVGVFSHVLGTDKESDVQGGVLAKAFLNQTLVDQKEDGRTGEQQEEREYNPLHLLSHCYLALWVKENNAIRFTNDEAFENESR